MQQLLLLGWLVKALSLKNGTKALITPCAAKASVREQTKINYLGEFQRQEEQYTGTQQPAHGIIPLAGAAALAGGQSHTGKLESKVNNGKQVPGAFCHVPEHECCPGRRSQGSQELRLGQGVQMQGVSGLLADPAC